MCLRKRMSLAFISSAEKIDGVFSPFLICNVYSRSIRNLCGVLATLHHVEQAWKPKSQ
jgi:hypothetical protein